MHYLAEQDDNISARMTARVPQIEASLKEGEQQRNLGTIKEGEDRLSLQHGTRDELIAFVREDYSEAVSADAAAEGKWLETLSDRELRSAFGVVQEDVPSLRGRLQANGAAFDDVVAARGE